MLNKMLVTVFAVCLIALSAFAQQIPATNLEDLQGKKFNTAALNDTTNKPIVLAFWATWCLPCINELGTINDEYEALTKKYQFKMYAIATDDSRTIKKVRPLVNGKAWQFDVLLDANQDLKRALNIVNIPTLLVVKNGKVIYRHNGYIKGDENELYNIIKNNQ